MASVAGPLASAVRATLRTVILRRLMGSMGEPGVECAPGMAMAVSVGGVQMASKFGSGGGCVLTVTLSPRKQSGTARRRGGGGD